MAKITKGKKMAIKVADKATGKVVEGKVAAVNPKPEDAGKRAFQIAAEEKKAAAAAEKAKVKAEKEAAREAKMKAKKEAKDAKAAERAANKEFSPADRAAQVTASISTLPATLRNDPVVAALDFDKFTWIDCVAKFTKADEVQRVSFHYTILLMKRASEIYIQEHGGSIRGFIDKFSAETGKGKSYLYKLNLIIQNERVLSNATGQPQAMKMLKAESIAQKKNLTLDFSKDDWKEVLKDGDAAPSGKAKGFDKLKARGDTLIADITSFCQLNSDGLSEEEKTEVDAAVQDMENMLKFLAETFAPDVATAAEPEGEAAAA